MSSLVRTESKRRKIALLITNDNYVTPENRLTTCIRNGSQLGHGLRQIGFQVDIYLDVEAEMIRTVKEFNKSTIDGDLILFYFTGHAYAVDGKNYLLPVRDARIRTELDVQDLGTDVQRILERLLTGRSSTTVIMILDCCQPYMLRDGSRSTGLQAIRPPERAFLQFSCAVNQTTEGNLYHQCLLRYIADENTVVQDIFQRVFAEVNERSNQQQQPFSIDRLLKHEHLYLNEIYRPLICPLEEIDPNETQIVRKSHAQMSEYFGRFPNIEDLFNENDPNLQQIQKFTDDISQQKPSGDVGDHITVCHIIYQLLGGTDKQCFFYDSRKGMSHPNDASAHLLGYIDQQRPLVLTLEDSEGLGDENYVRMEQHDFKLAHTLNLAIQRQAAHPVLDDIQQRLAKAHNVSLTQIQLRRCFEGSCSIVYTVDRLDKSTLFKIQNSSPQLKKQFKQFRSLKIHPLLYRPAFDISYFDNRGDRDFSDRASTYKIGPRGREQTYIQPLGWRRYGLKVLGRYSNDLWLQPFSDPRNWYRAYHGTANASRNDFKESDSSSDSLNLPVKAMANIFKNGFNLAKVAKHGPGVYCSPDPNFIEEKYVTEVEIGTKQGKKAFKYMLQVAVEPDGVVFTSVKEIWRVPKPENIRTYGILIKDGDGTHGHGMEDLPQGETHLYFRENVISPR